MKRSIIRGFAITGFVFLMGWGLAGLSDFKAFSAFDPISQALEEFELTDIVFSQIREQPEIDQRIVLVNLGHSRMEIGQQIMTISQHGPKVIGVDSFFNCEGGTYDIENCPQLADTLGNLVLSNAIQEAGNVVLVARLLQSDSLFNVNPGDVYDSMEYSDPMFSDHAHNAYANLPTGDKEGKGAATYQEDVKICKHVIPKMTVRGKQELAFSVQMAMLYDSVKTQRFLERGKYEEIINFRGNIDIADVKVKSLRESMDHASGFKVLCYAVDRLQLAEGSYDSTIFKNSIVILGYLGDYFGDTAWEDRFFTPLNTKVAGRANPDMFGPVVHANVVSMILHEDYINEIPGWMQILIAVFVCFLNVLLFRWVDDKLPSLFDGLSVLLQIVQIFLTSAVIVYAFWKFNLKLELSLTMAGLALVGPCFDIAKSIENSFSKSLTTKDQEVLTTQNQEIS